MSATLGAVRPDVPGSDSADVAIVAWPADAARRDELARSGTPRLLVVDPGTSPPALVDCLEDWVFAPVAPSAQSDLELQARSAALTLRAGCHHRLVPALDEEGFLSYGAQRVHVPPVEARLVGALLERYGAVVSANRLARAAWPDGNATRGMLDVRIHRLRRRLEPLGLVIRTVRQRGWILEALAPAGP